ncbi:MAG: hypothetical protein SOX31_07710 [Eubacteriales bacterium]|nr:hypothetical protein [Eubacteriales bacterium]MDY3286440.1 hypothetical protein [Eubacteriales bacterium]
MRITAIFETEDLADRAAAAIAGQIPLSKRRVVSLEGVQDAVPPYVEQPAMLAAGFENIAVTNGAAFSGFDAGMLPFGAAFPLPWTSITPEQAPGEASREARLELDVDPADAGTAEKLLVNLHGRAITAF